MGSLKEPTYTVAAVRNLILRAGGDIKPYDVMVGVAGHALGMVYLAEEDGMYTALLPKFSVRKLVDGNYVVVSTSDGELLD
jgi:hypothetical protein